MSLFDFVVYEVIDSKILSTISASIPLAELLSLISLPTPGR